MAAQINKLHYDKTVFINCPFDESYLPLFQAAIFVISWCGFTPTSSKSEDNGLDNRIDKISRLIEQCRYGVHDISRTELNPSGWPRFNMPFELGLFYGARRFGNKQQRTKNALILERSPYSYQQFLSDINGIDIQAHGDDPYKIIQHVRNWLSTNSEKLITPGIHAIWDNYQKFLEHLPHFSRAIGFRQINDLPIVDFCGIVEIWLEEFENIRIINENP